jgi:hypothetical protein
MASNTGDTGPSLSLKNTWKTTPGNAYIWRIFNMTWGYGNKLGFYNYDYTNPCAWWMCQERFSIYDNGNVFIPGNLWIGTITPSYKLHVNGTAAWTSWTNISDIRYKKEVSTITWSLEKLEKLRWVSYKWKQDEYKDKGFDDKKHLWFIAQEVEKVLPEIVTTDDKWYKWVEYANITAVLVEAIKEQQKEIKESKNEIEENKKENETLKQENKEILSILCLDTPTAEICK